MAKHDQAITGVERHFEENEIIVSKTDLKGHLTYINDVFLRLADMSEKEALGQPHNVIRHPDMPRCIFKLLWDTIQGGEEIFAYVINRAMNGDHYWVMAHVTPSRDASGNIVGYHSNRRIANPATLKDTIIPLYRELVSEENRHPNRKDGLDASVAKVTDLLSSKGVEVNEFFLGV